MCAVRQPTLRAPHSHLLHNVMLLDKRFARPRADLHHRPKKSGVRRQGLDSPRSFSVTVLTTLLVPTRPPGRASRRVLSLPKTPVSCSSSAASVGVVPHGQWAHLDKLCLALIDRSTKLVEASLCLDSLLRHCDTCAYSVWLMSSSTSRSNAALTPPLTASCLWSPRRHCKSFHCSSCPRLLSSRRLPSRNLLHS